MGIDFAHQRRMFSTRARCNLTHMHQRILRDQLPRRAKRSLPYAILGVRVNRRMRRSRLTEDEQMRLGNVHAELARMAVLIAHSELTDQKQVATRLALGLAYDVPMFATAVASIADQARQDKSRLLLLAYRAAIRALLHSCHLLAGLKALATRVWMPVLLLRELAALEPAALTLDHEWPPDATARLDLPEGVRHVRTVAPTNGPNDRTEALLVLGSVALAA